MQSFQSSISHDNGFKHHKKSCELIEFNSNYLNIFAAEVRHCEPHWHEAPELIYVLSGAFEVTANQSLITIKKGDFLYLGPDIIHSLEQTCPRSTLITWQFSQRLFDAMHKAPNSHLQLDSFHPGYGQLHHLFFAHLQSLSKDITSPFERLAKVYNILSKIDECSEEKETYDTRFQTRESSIIRESMKFINCNFKNKITVTELARRANLSYFHFSRLFKKISGYTATEYISMVRVNMAKPLLKNINIPITEVSQTVGFNEHRLMNMAFKKYSNETPSEYRKRFLSDPDWRQASSDLNTYPNKPLKIKDVFNIF
ncbi:AraC family transcriptional regulator [Salinivibrio kushneri]|uniref:AraC family transcriptional regulator n=1 Tax=Salinivibrio kushneri TaxID=1908198 RepID=UPI00098880DF|nr:helix-turn-helix domain-containing protein [Salinivibrio kushneri]OOE49425.1 hypothetical protein BZG12_15920 [Salinivibrio kushneri]